MSETINEVMVVEACEIARRAHIGQKDKGGSSYIEHPLRVMSAMVEDDYAGRITSVLHDVVEDTSVTLAELVSWLGIPAYSGIAFALETLTKRRKDSYGEFIERIVKSDSELAVRVKIADLEDNMDIRRLPSLGNSDLQRLVKYHRAWRHLKGER